MRQLLILAAFAAAVLMPNSVALGGGWFSVSLDPLPAEIVAGEPYEISYLVRRHGLSPESVEGTSVRITAPGRVGTDFVGHRRGPVGHHIAQVAFPTEGRWSWEVTGLYSPQLLGSVTVAPRGSAGNAADRADALLGSGALALMLFGLLALRPPRATLSEARA